MQLSFGVISGSTRPSGAGKAVADWVMQEAEKTEDTYTLVDLREIDLPFLDEANPPMMRQYEHVHTKKWSKTIDELDGYIWILPEYNHGYPASLKNAIDFLYHEWIKKPVAMVSYGGMSGGIRAVEQMRQVAIELQMVPIRDQVAIPHIYTAVDDGVLQENQVQGDIGRVFDALSWWGAVLKEARQRT